MDVTLKTYLTILHRIEKAERLANYKEVLYYSLEGLTYISYAQHLNKPDRIIANKSLEYLTIYLAVLREERELKKILRVIKRYLPNENFTESITGYINTVDTICGFIKKNPGCQLNEILRQLNNQQVAIKMINSALQLNIICKKRDQFYFFNKELNLKEVLAS